MSQRSGFASYADSDQVREYSDLIALQRIMRMSSVAWCRDPVVFDWESVVLLDKDSRCHDKKGAGAC
jgi:hypothetical protein